MMRGDMPLLPSCSFMTWTGNTLLYYIKCKDICARDKKILQLHHRIVGQYGGDWRTASIFS